MRRVVGSMALFCVWEHSSSLLPLEWKTWGFLILGGLLITSLGLWMDDKNMTAVWVATSLAAFIMIVWIELKVGGVL
jgi:hypothetical protein